MENSCVLIGLDTSISSTGVSIYLNGELASYFSLNQTNKKLTSDEMDEATKIVAQKMEELRQQTLMSLTKKK